MRDIRIDNVKGLLMLLTVLGHMLELSAGGTSSAIYRIIYSFHMPAFIFISGYLAKQGLSKLLRFHLPLYLVSQFVYLLFDQYFIGSRLLSLSEFLTPYWHLWYLFALMLYQPLIPLLSRARGRSCAVIFIISVALSLAFPFTKTNLYPLSIGRAFAFLPFFTAGYFCGHEKSRLPQLSLLIPLSIPFIMTGKGVTIKMLYGSFSYSEPNQMLIRAALILFAFGYISLLMILPQKDTLASFIGKNTLPVYLIHGFILKAMKARGAVISDPLTALLLAILICASLTNIHYKNLPKAVDSIRKKVYNIIKMKGAFSHGYQGKDRGTCRKDQVRQGHRGKIQEGSRCDC